MNEQEKLLADFLLENFRTWYKDDKYDQKEILSIINYIDSIGETFTGSFVKHLFFNLRGLARSGTKAVDDYGLYYGDTLISKKLTLEELAHQRDLISSQKISKPKAQHAAKKKHEQEFAAACKDVRELFNNFKQGKAIITNQRGKIIPPEKWTRETFVNYCISKKAGWGKNMLRKVYIALSAAT